MQRRPQVGGLPFTLWVHMHAREGPRAACPSCSGSTPCNASVQWAPLKPCNVWLGVAHQSLSRWTAEGAPVFAVASSDVTVVQRA